MTEFERGRQSGIISGLRMAIVAVMTLQDRVERRPLTTAAARRLRKSTYRIAAREINAWLWIETRGRPASRARRARHPGFLRAAVPSTGCPVDQNKGTPA